jgi:hypothetical protein
VDKQRDGPDRAALLDMYVLARYNLGDELLARLLRRSSTSLHSYASERQQTPTLVATRLEWVHRVTYDLAGGYTAAGMQAWFARGRVQLENQSPLQVLASDWQPSDDGAAAVAALASTLRGPG